MVEAADLIIQETRTLEEMARIILAIIITPVAAMETATEMVILVNDLCRCIELFARLILF